MDLLFIIGILIGAIAGAWVIYSIQRPKLEQIEQLNTEIKEENIAQKNLKENLIRDIENSRYELLNFNNLREQSQKEYFSLQEKLKKEQQLAESASQKYYDKMMEIQKKKLEIDSAKEQEKFDEIIGNYTIEYTEILNDVAQTVFKEVSNGAEKIQKIKEQIDDLQSIVNAAVEANKRAEEIRQKESFYKLHMLDEDIKEIKELRECFKNIRNPEPLNKVIWKCYYEKPYTDLVGRVVGSGTHCGIYKITNIENGMCYIGQAVNIGDRWKQHIKRGIGAEAPTRNKLYPAMIAEGVENFSFEIIEECERSLLNEREDYWQNYFKAKEFGYSIK